jgi:prevent-host-death family protein
MLFSVRKAMTKNSYSMTEAKKHWERLLRRVIQGEKILITKWGTPMVKLVPPKAKGKQIGHNVLESPFAPQVPPHSRR